MEYKKAKEHIAFDYRARSSTHPASRGKEQGRRGRSSRAAEHSPSESHASTHRRVVSMPKEIAQPRHWADRQANKPGTNVELRARSRFVKRTLAQTGVPASEGQVRLIRPLPRQPHGANIPVRSGRRKARSGSFWRRMLTMIALFALFVIGIVGVSFALSSSNFQIHQIDIMGTQNTKLVNDIQRMGIQGQNIFLLDAGNLTERIEALPMVDSVSLSKQLPNLVVINVVERTPVLLWQTQQGTFSVDRKGVVIAAASDTTGTDHLMTIVDVSKEVGKQIHPGTLLNAANIAFATQAYTRLEHLPGVSSFTLRYDVIPSQGGHGSFIVVSSNGWLAYLGGADDNNPLDNRLIELQQILNMAQQKQLNLATIDLRFGLRPVYTLKS